MFCGLDEQLEKIVYLLDVDLHDEGSLYHNE
jgi:hypothetical protein